MSMLDELKTLVKGKPTADLLHQGQMEYKVYDHTYRDIYSLDIVEEPKGKVLVDIFTWLIMSLVFMALVIFIPLLIDLALLHIGYFSILKILFFRNFGAFTRLLIFLSLMYLLYTLVKTLLTKYFWSQNVDKDTELLKKYREIDSRIQQPEELSENFDIFPDAGAHSKNTAVTAVLGHMMLTNDGLNQVKMLSRADGKNDVDEYGNLINKNIPFIDEHGDYIYESKPMIDEEFGDKLFDSSSIPRATETTPNKNFIQSVLRRRYNPSKLLYNPHNKFGKPKFKTVAEYINHDWYIPDYEVQRPAGMYFVDTEPANTMILAMTRAGKGQTIIEPTIDMWMRSDYKRNIVANDPKGELYLKFYYVARKRGYRVIAFNLMNESRTNIYNPLGYAVDAARRGNNQATEEYVKTIGDVFFPPDKSDDPMWPNAANATFQRSALGLIDLYMEEEREIRIKAESQGWSVSRLNQTLDELWGHVTLYNVYQMMTQLASIKSTDTDLIRISENDTSDEKDYLTLFFDATRMLPTNALRTSIHNQDDSLRAMAQSDKTIASVYGISLTAIKFFADEKISRLTSGRPSQNFDIVGLSFPRRFELHLDNIFVKGKSLRGARFKWSAFEDVAFKKSLGKEFEYENNIDAHGWVQYVTKGIMKSDVSYFKLELFEQATRLPLYTFYFKFTKSYQRSLDGSSFVIDPVSHDKVVLGGELVELRKKHIATQIDLGTVPVYQEIASYIKSNGGAILDQRLAGKRNRILVRYQLHDGSNYGLYFDSKTGKAIAKVKYTSVLKPGNTTLKRSRVSLLENISDDDINRMTEAERAVYKKLGERTEYDVRLFDQVDVHWVEEPAYICFITPPHLMSYNKIALILLNQMFNMQVDKSYLTLKSQKPLYETMYMLDEVGNLQSDGTGIPFLQTKESIGLAQGQYYTLILQTLQQLQDIYGDSIDKILEGNTSNILYIKSTDDSMLERLEGLSGTIHRLQYSSRTINRSQQPLLANVRDDIAVNQDFKEEPVISKNTMLLIPKANMMVFGKGNPVWNGNQLSMPYSYQLLGNNKLMDFENPVDYTLQTVPTTANTMDFDILNNQPNFIYYVKKRVDQAKIASKVRKLYKQRHSINGRPLSESDLSRMDPEQLSKDLMRAINEQLAFDKLKTQLDSRRTSEFTDDMEAVDVDSLNDSDLTELLNTVPNATVIAAQAEQDKKVDDFKKIRYAHVFSRADLKNAGPGSNVYNILSDALEQCQLNGNVPNGFVYSKDDVIGANGEIFAKRANSANEINGKKIPSNNIETDGDLAYMITEHMINYLISLDSWDDTLGEAFCGAVNTAWHYVND